MKRTEIIKIKKNQPSPKPKIDNYKLGLPTRINFDYVPKWVG
jgi:hypothetical protein